MSKILLVDDSAAVRLTIAAILEQAGHEIEWCTSATGAWRRLVEEDESFDLVITDLNMPKMSGLDLIRALREHERLRDLPVLILTAERDRAKQVEARTSGATGWVNKPVASVPLLAAVKMVLPLSTS